MKKVSIFLLFSLVSLVVFAQQKPTDLDKSPMDMSYWPNTYPILKLSGKVKEAPIARIIYGRPQKNGRVIFDGIVKYNEMWRLGANEATEIEFLKNVKINGKSMSKGRYTLYCIPNIDKWTIIFSKDNYSWGSYSYNAKNDVFRIDIAVEKNTETVEAFTAFFEENKTGANLTFMWDDIKTQLPIFL